MSDEEITDAVGGQATYDAFQGEIRAFPYGFVPVGWIACDGQTLSIEHYTALYSIIGTVYGGDGRTGFCLPDLRDRVPLGAGDGNGLTPRPLGQSGGTNSVTLSVDEMPSHTHTFSVSTARAAERQPAGQYFAQGDGIGMYAPAKSDTAFDPGMLTYAGGGAAHDNQMPYLYVRYAICILGTWPG